MSVRRPDRRRWRGGLALAVAGALFALAAVQIGRGNDVPPRTPAASTTRAAAPSLASTITRLQNHLRQSPRDWQGWANLGLDYVQQARLTVDPTYYPRAEGSLRRSLRLHPHDNFTALAGLGALAAGRHDFTGALALTQRAARINPYNSTIYGAMADALTQLGRYREARVAITRMLHLHPGTPAFARLSYADELAGHRAAAHADLRQALVDATSPSDVAFVRYYLGELAFTGGHVRAALHEYAAGLRADPTYPDLLEGRAKAEAALGLTTRALRDYAAVVRRVPQPTYVIEYGELLQSLGRRSAAARQYALFDSEVRLFEANGVTVDLEPAVFYADHGSPAKALRYGRRGMRNRPFVEMADALAWALHLNGDDVTALRYSRRALSVGLRSALFHFHAGMILDSLGRTGAAHSQLRTALRINPHFDPLRAPIARRVLASSGSGR